MHWCRVKRIYGTRKAVGEQTVRWRRHIEYAEDNIKDPLKKIYGNLLLLKFPKEHAHS